MTWFFAALMVVGLWLILRKKETRTDRVVSRYQTRQIHRKRREKQRKILAANLRDKSVATEEEQEVLREEYARQKTLAEIRERAEIETKGYNRY